MFRRPNSWPGRRFGDAPCLQARRSAIHSAEGLETARVLGEDVLAKFLCGELDYAQKAHTKHLPFAALADHAVVVG